MSLQDAYDQVKAFHAKHGFTVEVPYDVGPEHLSERVEREDVYHDNMKIVDFASILALMAATCENCAKRRYHSKMLRCALMLEELSELMLAIAQNDELLMLDAMADLLYVVIGCAVTYGLPINAAFEEVHKSNMTKDVKTADDLRLRNKGSSYVTPDMKKVLAMARRGKR